MRDDAQRAGNDLILLVLGQFCPYEDKGTQKIHQEQGGHTLHPCQDLPNHCSKHSRKRGPIP